MRSIIAALRTLVLPFGATSGQRIILSGVDGTIAVYDATGALRFRLGIPDAFELFTADAAELFAANIYAARFGAIGSPARNLALHLASPLPTGAGRERAWVSLISSSVDNTEPPELLFYSDVGNLDAKLEGRSLPRGLLAGGRFASTGNDSARAAGVLTDMAVTVALKANRLYKVTLNSQFSLGTAGAVYAEELDHDGTIVGRFARQVPAETPAGSTLHYVGTTVDYVPSADDASATLTVANAAGSGGNITAQPPTSGPRSLTVIDAGAV